MPKKTNKSKIVLVSNTSWYLYNFRVKLLFLIKSYNYELFLICPRDEYTEKLEKLGFKIYNWDLQRRSINPLKELISVYKLARIYIQIKPNIVHHFTIKACIYGSISAFICNVKVVINSFTGLGHFFISNNLKIKFIRKISRIFIKIIFSKINTKLILQNNSDRKKLLKLKITTKNKSIVIPGSGVDLDYFYPQEKIFDKNMIKLLFPSRLIKEKGIMELIRACLLLEQDNIPIKLYIAGKLDEGNRSSLNKEEIDVLKKLKNVFLMGHIEDMRNLYRKIDIVVLPSWREGLSKALLEAAAMEKAIITTNVPGCKEIVKHMETGLLVNVNNPFQIKESIIKIYNNPDLLKKFGEAARLRVKKKFEVKKINRMTIREYENLRN